MLAMSSNMQRRHRSTEHQPRPVRGAPSVLQAVHTLQRHPVMTQAQLSTLDLRRRSFPCATGHQSASIGDCHDRLTCSRPIALAEWLIAPVAADLLSHVPICTRLSNLLGHTGWSPMAQAEQRATVLNST